MLSALALFIPLFFLFKETATTALYTYLHTLSLHDALPIWAALRGATDADLPPLPEVHDLRWIAGAPSRRRAKGISDAASAALATEMRPFIKADDGASAAALPDQTQGLTPEATNEWRQRVPWTYDQTGRTVCRARVCEYENGWMAAVSFKKQKQ